MYVYDEDAKIYRGDPYSDPSIAPPPVPGADMVPQQQTMSAQKTDTNRTTEAMKDLSSAAQTTGSLTGSKQGSKLGSAIGTIAAAAALLSDKRAKYTYSDMDTKNVVPLADAGTSTLQVSPEGRAFYVDMQDEPQKRVPRASLSGRSSVGSSAPLAPTAPPKAKGSAPKYRPMSDDELSKWADQMMAGMRAQSEATSTPAVQPALDRPQEPPMFSDDQTKLRAAQAEAWELGRIAGNQGTAMRKDAIAANESDRARGREREIASRGDVSMKAQKEGSTTARSRIETATSKLRQNDAMAQARRAMAPSAYSYKEEFRPPDQAPGEVNVGPMAQNMAADPVASTAVKRDPGTGMLAIDRDKALKLVMGSLADLQLRADLERRR